MNKSGLALNRVALSVTTALCVALSSSTAFAHLDEHIIADSNQDVVASFDVVHAKVVKKADHLIFQTEVRDAIGEVKPQAVGQLAGANVFSYVWPTTLNSADIGFEQDKGIVALAVTAHPDFDDTPKYDENGDGDLANDGALWHSHWVVLTEDAQCPEGLTVRDIPAGETPKVPATWPELPIYIDSPDYAPKFTDKELRVKVPKADIGLNDAFNFDSVTAVLKVNDSIHAPLLCVTGVYDIASGDLSLPGEVSRK
ncbi:hypothetical protein [Vibrio scophthalmi]|uniref:Uncharacterized protein n=1 Tax=Vibrio scophthalmi LMG 19158 TaxID=870967 RepID=F9RS45_9VIBR|nr:hypothetical protein [Vibrio scophthalmi]EGU32549.1 hypothetical protein VIS19158_12907 [Vibrio scophthalmi LMG 19158]